MFVQGLEVVVQAFINLEVSNLGVGEYSNEPSVDSVSEDDNDKEEPEENEEGHSWVMRVAEGCEDFGPSVASWLDITVLVDIVNVIITEQLLVGDHPIAE